MDRGIVSEENLAAIRKRGGPYLVGTPRRQMKRFEAELLKDDWTQVRADVEVKQIAIPQGEETYILCRTAVRKEKERAIRKRFSLGMERALEALEKSIASGRLKDRYKMERRMGRRVQAPHPQINDLFEVTLRDTPAGVRLRWEMKEDREAWQDLREGAYMLRTNLQADSAEQMWSMYMQLPQSGGVVSRAQEQAFDSTLVSPEGGTSEGPRPSGLSWLCPVGDTEASAAASVGYRPTILGRRRGQCSAFLPDEGTGVALHAAERRHRAAHYGWTRDPPTPNYRADNRTEIPTVRARPGST
jgi:hypothetical protein